ncbi:hypothetical protein [Flavobacterium denitrificans]|uniref:hypothetical protein n=1 Tax=Flavobacterium denitrificans TaxID=281361 RepID=UPI00041B6B88|nr:hypothetical protein [Flavobacterium denitrificans]
MNKFLFVFLLVISLQSCEDSYKTEELKAIEDISNDFLIKKDLDVLLNVPDSIDHIKVYKPNVDSLDIKVYLSDALVPIAQEKEDNLWMFKNNNFSKSDSIVFYGIVNSSRFKGLRYREFDKKKIKLKKPYSQSEISEVKIVADQEYKILKFSRVCFDTDKQNGIVVVELLTGLEYGTQSGFNGSILIKKKNNKWVCILPE